MATLTAEQLDDLQVFVRDWLRHCGRSQSDLRRALRAASVRMPVLIDTLHLTYSRGGVTALVEQLCGIEAQWHGEDQAAVLGEPPGLGSSLEQLDLLLQEIRQTQPD